MPIKIVNCTGVLAATQDAAKDKVAVTIAVPRKLLVLDAWLQENFDWSLADWIEYLIPHFSSPRDLEEGIPMDLAEKFDLHPALRIENANEVRQLFGLEPFEYDPLNRVVSLDREWICSLCGKKEFLYQAIREGYSKGVFDLECLRKAGYEDVIF
jgi:hypothetical protein